MDVHTCGPIRCGMRHQLFAHIVWTTMDRAPLIDRGRAQFLAEQLPIIAGQERATILAMGIVSTHVHLLLRLEPATAIPRLAQRLKGTTSRGMTHANGSALRWAKGYAIQSVSTRALTIVAHYVETQSAHHPHEAIPGWSPASAGS